jgi:hypothetical protein
MTYAEAHSLAMDALDAVGRAGMKPRALPGRDAELQAAITAAQTAVGELDALAASEPAPTPHEALKQRWARAKAHWESTLTAPARTL